MQVLDSPEVPRILPWSLLLLALLALAMVYLRNGIIYALYPYGLENGEALVLRFCQFLSEGKPVYAPLDSGPPFIGCNYPPLYLALVALLLKTGVPIFFAGRLISLLSIAGIAFCLVVLALRLGAHWIFSMVGGLLFFSVTWVNTLTPLARVDMLAVFLSIGGIVLLMPRNNSGAPQPSEIPKEDPLTFRELLGILLLALATFAKQTGVFSSAAYVLWVLGWKRRRLLRTILLLGGAGFLLHGGALLLTKGQYFKWVAIYSSGQYSADRLFAYLAFYFQHDWLEAVPSLLLVGIWMKRWFFPAEKKPKRWRIKRGSINPTKAIPALQALPFVYFLMAAASCVLTARSGSSFHYFLEVTALASAFSGLLLWELWLRFGRRRFGEIGLAVVSLLVLGAHVALHSGELLRWGALRGASAEFGDRMTQAALNGVSGPILAEELTYEVNEKKEPFLVNPFIYADMERRGLWDSAPVVSALEQGKFRALCFNSSLKEVEHLTLDRFGEKILRAAARQYPYELPIQYERFLYFRRMEDYQKAFERAQAEKARIEEEQQVFKIVR
jgi:hypothetical protein